jgi:ankyrin repeat protein
MNWSGLVWPKRVSDSLQHGSTPLHHACHEGKDEVVSVLLAAGANIEALGKVWREAMRMSLISFRRDGLRCTLLVVDVKSVSSLHFWRQVPLLALETR